MNLILVIVTFLNKFLKIFKVELKSKPENFLEDDKYFNKLVKLVYSKTLVSIDSLFMLYQFFKSISRLEGNVVECGVYKGGSAKFLSQLSMKVSPNKTIYLLDTFEGMPECDPNLDWFRKGDLKYTDIKTLKEYLADCKNIKIYKGIFSKTFSNLKNKKFCFVHVDVDIYSSVKECCEFFYPRLVNRGLIIFDDYGFPTCIGAKKAVDEFFKDKAEIPIYLPTGQCFVRKILD